MKQFSAMKQNSDFFTKYHKKEQRCSIDFSFSKSEAACFQPEPKLKLEEKRQIKKLITALTVLHFNYQHQVQIATVQINWQAWHCLSLKILTLDTNESVSQSQDYIKSESND